MSLLANRATLGVASNTADNGQEKGAFISFGFDKYGDGETLIGGDTVKITGQTIAGAIAAQDLIIKNKSYLKGNGDAIFGAGTNGESRFLADGTGYIANETISWGNGETQINDLYIGPKSAGWHMYGGMLDQYGDVDIMPFIWAQTHDTTNSKYINLAIRPDCIESYSTVVEDNGQTIQNPSGTGTNTGRVRTTNWQINQDGSAIFAKGYVTFNADGSAVIGNQTTNITMSNSGTISLTGIGVSISAADQLQIGTTVKNNITGDSTFIGTIANAAGVTVKGNLNTDDLSVGNGSCFFKGDDYSADTDHGRTYPVGSAGAGHLANGNIWWDKVGNLHAKGLMTNRCEYISGNSNQTVVLDGNNLHSVTLAPMEHRMVVLPTYSDFTDPTGGWFVKGYKEDGTVINIKTESCDSCSNWSMIDEEAWFDGHNWAGTADLFKHCTLVCADPATLCTGGGNSGNLPVHSWKGASPTTPCTVSAEFKDNAMLNTAEDVDFPYYEGRFCARGAYSRFILLPPGQSLTLVSSIQKITVNNTEKSYLVWNVENASEFNFIKMGIVDRLNNSDMFDENNGLMESRREENGTGDGLLSYKYMSLNYYTKENTQQGVTGPDTDLSIYI